MIYLNMKECAIIKICFVFDIIASFTLVVLKNMIGLGKELHAANRSCQWLLLSQYLSRLLLFNGLSLIKTHSIFILINVIVEGSWWPQYNKCIHYLCCYKAPFIFIEL